MRIMLPWEQIWTLMRIIIQLGGISFLDSLEILRQSWEKPALSERIKPWPVVNNDLARRKTSTHHQNFAASLTWIGSDFNECMNERPWQPWRLSRVPHPHNESPISFSMTHTPEWRTHEKNKFGDNHTIFSISISLCLSLHCIRVHTEEEHGHDGGWSWGREEEARVGGSPPSPCSSASSSSSLPCLSSLGSCRVQWMGGSLLEWIQINHQTCGLCRTGILHIPSGAMITIS